MRHRWVEAKREPVLLATAWLCTAPGCDFAVDLHVEGAEAKVTAHMDQQRSLEEADATWARLRAFVARFGRLPYRAAPWTSEHQLAMAVARSMPWVRIEHARDSGPLAWAHWLEWFVAEHGALPSVRADDGREAAIAAAGDRLWAGAGIRADLERAWQRLARAGIHAPRIAA